MQQFAPPAIQDIFSNKAIVFLHVLQDITQWEENACLVIAVVLNVSQQHSVLDVIAL